MGSTTFKNVFWHVSILLIFALCIFFAIIFLCRNKHKGRNLLSSDVNRCSEMTTMKSKKSDKQGKWWMYAKKTAKRTPSSHVKTHLENDNKTKPNPGKEQSIVSSHKKKNKRKRKSKSKTLGTNTIPENISKSEECLRSTSLEETTNKKSRENAVRKCKVKPDLLDGKTSGSRGNQLGLSHKSGTDNEQQGNDKKTKLSKKKRRKLKILKRREKEKAASEDSSEHNHKNKMSKVAKRTKDSHPASVKAESGDNRMKERNAQSEKAESHSLDPSPPDGPVSQGDGSQRKRKRKQAKKQQQQQEGKSVKRRKMDKETLDSGMSSGAETPNLPSKPEDLAANWKVLVSVSTNLLLSVFYPPSLFFLHYLQSMNW